MECCRAEVRDSRKSARGALAKTPSQSAQQGDAATHHRESRTLIGDVSVDPDEIVIAALHGELEERSVRNAGAEEAQVELNHVMRVVAVPTGVGASREGSHGDIPTDEASDRFATGMIDPRIRFRVTTDRHGDHLIRSLVEFVNRVLGSDRRHGAVIGAIHRLLQIDHVVVLEERIALHGRAAAADVGAPGRVAIDIDEDIPCGVGVFARHEVVAADHTQGLADDSEGFQIPRLTDACAGFRFVVFRDTANIGVLDARRRTVVAPPLLRSGVRTVLGDLIEHRDIDAHRSVTKDRNRRCCNDQIFEGQRHKTSYLDERVSCLASDRPTATRQET